MEADPTAGTKAERSYGFISGIFNALYCCRGGHESTALPCLGKKTESPP